MQVIEGNICVIGKKFVIVVLCFNSFVVESLLEGVFDILECYGEVSDDDVILVCVLGVYELFVVVKKLVEFKKFDVIIVLGVVICGGIFYFDFVVGECNKGLVQVLLEYGILVLFGVIIIDFIE